MRKIWLIRHGATEANGLQLYCGSTDIPLSEEGRTALMKLRGAVPDADYVTSGMRRANETMMLLFGNHSFRVDPAFREINFGIFEMQSYEELKCNPAYQRWLQGDNMRNIPPGGESGMQMADRVCAAFRELEARDRDTILITHGGVIAAIMDYRFPEEGKNRYEWQPEPGKGYCISDSGWVSIPQEGCYCDDKRAL